MSLIAAREDRELARLLKRAAEQFERMSPGQRAIMLRAQRRSWAIGELMLEHPELSYAEAAKRVDGALVGPGVE